MKLEECAEALFQCLPADDLRQMHTRLCKEMHRRVPPWVLRATISYVRKNYEEVGYTIPHVKRGSPATGESGRWFAVLTERDGTFYFDDQHRDHLDSGTCSTVASITQQMRNLKAIVGVCQQYERSHTRKEYLADLEENFDYTAKRAARVLKFIQREMNDAA